MTESLFTYSIGEVRTFVAYKKTKGLLNVWGGTSSKASLRAEDGAGSLPYSEQPCEAQLNWKESIRKKVFQSSGSLCDLAKSFLKLFLSNSIQLLKSHTPVI